MIKYILIGGHIHKAQDGGKAFCDELIKDTDGKQIKILDCLFARPLQEWDTKFQDDKNFFQEHLQNFEIELATPENFLEQVKKSDIIFFQGGVPHQLMSIIATNGDWVKELDGKVLVGSSGGADAICKYYGVGKTSNIGEGLGLLPIKFIPHWKSDYAPGIVINWDELFNKLKTHKENLKIVTLGEGEFIVFNDARVALSE
ncbi:MAG: Type 1 glutamine amidotransferase-like domain-containing protein [Patescibacteria group bacterium]